MMSYTGLLSAQTSLPARCWSRDNRLKWCHDRYMGQWPFTEKLGHVGNSGAFYLLDIHDAQLRERVHDVADQHFAAWYRCGLHILHRPLTGNIVGRDESDDDPDLIIDCERRAHTGVFHMLQRLIDLGGLGNRYRGVLAKVRLTDTAGSCGSAYQGSVPGILSRVFVIALSTRMLMASPCGDFGVGAKRTLITAELVTRNTLESSSTEDLCHARFIPAACGNAGNIWATERGYPGGAELDSVRLTRDG
jgi:hypothetical protein